jgi:plastocyanin
LSRRLMVAVMAIAALGLSGTAVAAKKSEIRIVGGVTVKPNKFVKDDQRFKAGVVTVRSGKSVTYVNKAKTPDPHTISLVDKLPRTMQQIFGCEACGAFFEAHEVPEGDGPPAKPIVDVGEAGFDTAGDSIVVGPGDKGSFKVTAAKGTTLKYLCAVHPWMQGKIRVK